MRMIPVSRLVRGVVAQDPSTDYIQVSSVEKCKITYQGEPIYGVTVEGVRVDPISGAITGERYSRVCSLSERWAIE